MNNGIAALWRENLPRGVLDHLQAALPPGGVRVFFRADDIAVPDRSFIRMTGLFQRHRISLGLAVVPQWITPARWDALEIIKRDDPLWCWHQHGFSHVNHAVQGKKCEFGDDRALEAIHDDLARGRDILLNLLGSRLVPIFTPPWNRCGRTTLDLLPTLGFQGISRFTGATPPAPRGLTDCSCNVDLHTRREPSAIDSWRNLLHQWRSAAATGTIGIMLHHQLMNDRAFDFLDSLLGLLAAAPPPVELVSMRDLPGRN